MSNGRERNENSDTQQGLKHCDHVQSCPSDHLWNARFEDRDQAWGNSQSVAILKWLWCLKKMELVSLSLNGNNMQATVNNCNKSVNIANLFLSFVNLL